MNANTMTKTEAMHLALNNGADAVWNRSTGALVIRETLKGMDRDDAQRITYGRTCVIDAPSKAIVAALEVRNAIAEE